MTNDHNILNDAGDDDCPPSPAPKSPRANECSANNKTNFKIYSHNVNGLRDETKLEYIPRFMRDNNIDAYLIQETHLPGDFEKILLLDYYLIHHGPEHQPASGAKGGVAIILSPDLAVQWKTSGTAKKKIRGGPSIGNTTRALSISMKFEVAPPINPPNKPKSKVAKKRFHNLCLTTLYFPHSGYKEKELDEFTNDMSTYISNILSQKNTTHIKGADTNSSIGTCASLPEANLSDKQESHLDIDPAFSLLGPFGNPHRSKSGENLLNIMREHQLRAAATFFDNNNKYNTWLAPPHPSTGKRHAYQLDHIFIPKYQLCHTKNIKRRFNGATSDHAALFIDFELSSIPLLKKKAEKNDPPPASHQKN